MEIKVRQRDKRELRVEIVGESHSFCNALQNFLLKDGSVEFAGYNVSHPLVGNPVIHLCTNGNRKPENSLIDAAKSLNKTLDEVRKTFIEALEEEERKSGKGNEG